MFYTYLFLIRCFLKINLHNGVIWGNHNRIIIERVNCIHENAFHIKIVTDPIIEERNEDNNIIKMIDFN